VSHPVQEEDRIATGKIILTAAISLAIFGVGALWSVSIQKAEMKSIVTQPHLYGPTELGKPEVGIVYQQPFNISDYGGTKQAEKELHLSTYGWVDKSAGVVHVPIEQAIQRYVAQSGGGK
jgi:hypothetical protein